jgi:4-hydroxy-3-methylbut-2-enyl diphosphate reductase
MKIILAEYCGFCYGVKRAVQIAEQAIGTDQRICTLGPIIHNPQLVEKLRRQGVGVVDNLDEIETGTVIIRSHGVGPQVYQTAQAKQLTVIDATCPHVKQAQQQAADFYHAGYQVIIIGEKQHPEVQSIAAWTDNNAFIVESVAEAVAKPLPNCEKVGIVSQTTFSSELFEAIVAALRTKYAELAVKRTICTATDQRQAAAVKTAVKVEIMLVIGGKNSANTCRLAAVARETGKKTYHIETAQELISAWFHGIKTVGITAGASTPDWIIEEVIYKVEEMDQVVNEQSAILEIGGIITGKVVNVCKDEVFVDIGYKAEGVISRIDLAFPTVEDANEVVKQGDSIQVYVVALDQDETPVKLSKLLADRKLAWSQLTTAVEQQLPVEVKVTEAIKGGLAAAFSGVRVFIPASQVSLHFIEDLSSYVGQSLLVQPIEIDETKNKAVLSRRLILQEERRLKEEEVYNNLVVGSTINATVSRLATFGAFVDVGGVDGLVHISDLSWERIASPDEVVTVGDAVTVKVLKVDKAAKRISLSLKQVQADPWYDKVAALVPGKIVDGTVTKITAFGAFVAIGNGLEGLVHLSELAEQRIAKVEDVVTNGQSVKVKVLTVDADKKKIALSIKDAQADLDRKEFQHYLGSENRLHVNLGDKFKDLFKSLK